MNTSEDAFNEFLGESQFDYFENKKKFIEHLNFLKNLSVEELVFYKKYVEVQNYRNFASMSMTTKAKIWKPSDIMDKNKTISEIELLKPKIEFVNPGSVYEEDWLMLRIFCHTMSFDQSPGRFLKFIIYDDVSKKFLGAVSVASDVITIVDRDKYIGWTSDQRLKGNKTLKNSAIGSCIMSTQPFGYNFLGGKLVASLVTSKSVRDIWKELYGDVLVGITTTSLYGSQSMYNGIPYWHKCGSTSGNITLKPDDLYYEIWHRWIKENRKEEYIKKMTQEEGVSGPVTGAKQRVIQMIFNELGLKVKDFVHGFARGTYSSLIYENSKEFLQNKIEEKDLIIKSKFEKDVDGMMEWWKPKAINRYSNLLNDGRVKSDVLFYNDMLSMKYPEAKEKYYHEVGR